MGCGQTPDRKTTGMILEDLVTSDRSEARCPIGGPLWTGGLSGSIVPLLVKRLADTSSTWNRLQPNAHRGSKSTLGPGHVKPR